MISAVIFDMDGTITDTEQFYVPSWKEAFLELGVSDFTYEDALLLRSLNQQDALAMLSARFGVDKALYDRIHDLCGAKVREKTKGRVPLKPGVREILDFLRRQGILSAVATATQLTTASERLSSAGLLDSFDTVISAHQVARGKPHPDVYLYACRQLGFLPANCLAIEDSPNGVRSASSAGCPTVMVPDLTPPDAEMISLTVGVCPTLYALEDFILEFEEAFPSSPEV